MTSDQEHPNRTSVLVVDSDGSVRVSLDYLFGGICPHNVKVMSNCAAAERVLAESPAPGVVVVGCYGLNSGHLELIRAAATMVPRPMIIAVDHESTPDNAVSAFLAGADDVVRLPFSLKEFALRVCVRLKAVGMACSFDFSGNNDWDAEAHVAHQAKLTSAEAQVLRVLIRRDGRIVSREELSRVIDNRPWEHGDRKFDVHVASIRKKLNTSFADRISVHTIRSAGYQLTVNEPESRFGENNRE
jgi:DNA-binding response OmpR family regulator